MTDRPAVLVLHLEGDAPLLLDMPAAMAAECREGVIAFWAGDPTRVPYLAVGAGDDLDTWIPLNRITTVRVLTPERAAGLYPEDVEHAVEQDGEIG